MAVDYNVLFQGGSPLDSAVDGFKTGIGLQQIQLANEKAKRDVAAQAQLQSDLAALSSNPQAKGSDFAAMMVKYPQLSEHFKRGWDTLNIEQQNNKLRGATEVYAAIQTGRNDVAVEILTQQATAARNSGLEQDAKAAERMAKLIEMSPDTAKTSVGLMLSAVMGPDKFADTFGKLGAEGRSAEKHVPEMEEARAKAKSAAVAARFAEDNAVKDLEKKGWDIEKIQEDIKIAKANTQIAALNAAINKEGNQIKREELKLKRDELEKKRNDQLQKDTAEIESARNTMDNFLNTADRILTTPNNVMRAAMGPLDSRLPTIQQDVADFESLMENFDAQAFLSQVPSMKGYGALSNAEGNKLGAALQSFSMRQSPEQLVTNVKEAQRLIIKARKNLSTKYGVPDNIPDTPAAAEATSPEDINILIEKYAPGVGAGS